MNNTTKQKCIKFEAGTSVFGDSYLIDIITCVVQFVITLNFNICMFFFRLLLLLPKVFPNNLSACNLICFANVIKSLFLDLRIFLLKNSILREGKKKYNVIVLLSFLFVSCTFFLSLAAAVFTADQRTLITCLLG